MSQTPPATAPPSSSPSDMPDRKQKTLRIVIAVVVTCAVLSSLALLVSALLPGLGNAKEQARGLVKEQVDRQAKERAKKEQAKQSVCTANLRAIGRAFCMYSAANDDWSPSDLKKLYHYIGGSRTQQRCPLRCPSARNNRDCDYFYRRPAASRLSRIEADLSKVITACDFKDNHDGKGRSVLFADGHAQWMSEEQFQQELQQSHNTAFAKALREAEEQ